MNSRGIALIAVIVGAIFSSAVAAIAKKGLEEIPPFSLVFLRFLVATIFVLPFFFRQKKGKLIQLQKNFPISLFALGNVMFFIFGVNLTTANVGGIIYAAVPLLSGVILYLFFKERLSPQKTMGILVGFIGVLIITLLPLIEKANPFSGNLLGNLFLACAVISWSFYMVYSKTLQEKYSPFIVTINFIFITGAISFPFFVWELFAYAGWWQYVSGWGIFSVFYIGLVITVFAYLLNQYAIKHGGAVFASTIFYLLPLLGFYINYLLLGEQLTGGMIIGSILALVGTFLVMKK